MTTVFFRFESANYSIEGQHETGIDSSILKGSSPYHGTTEGAIAWSSLRKEIIAKLPQDLASIQKESFSVVEEKTGIKLQENQKQKEFESLFCNETICFVGNPKRLGKWLIYEKQNTEKSLSKRVANAKESGFKSAWYKEDKVGVLFEDLA